MLRAVERAIVVSFCAALAAAGIVRGQDVGQIPADASPREVEIYQSTDPAVVTFRSVCVKCHTPDRVLTVRRTGAEWEETIAKMLTKGASGTDDELQTIFYYLVGTFGKVHINSAGAEEIAAVLGLSPDTSAALVRVRGQRGAFRTMSDLGHVRGVDPAKVSADAVVFD